MIQEYHDFIASKRRKPQPMGFEPVGKLNRHLFDWQARATDWAIRRGRAALFKSCGMGKTLCQLTWGEHVVRHSSKPAILLCPVGVRGQTKLEAEKFGIGVEVKVADKASDVITGINLVNYEKLHHFDLSVFAGVILDESSILKNYKGKTKTALVDGFARTPYRLACTATPAPNDHMELGNHSEFLGVMPSNEMLSRWFINDTMKAGGYRLRKHGQEKFWSWVATWAICAEKPSDVGGVDNDFMLPNLIVNRHEVSVEHGEAPDGKLFPDQNLSATNVHEEKRWTCETRCRKAASLANVKKGLSLIWCDTNYEADELKRLIPGSVEIRGTDKERVKEKAFQDFASGKIKKLITKPSIAGFGLNFQLCNHEVFAGLSYSFEEYYQAVRRCWRFGQKNPVTVDIVLADSESAIESAIARKDADHALMQSGMSAAMRRATFAELGLEVERERYKPLADFVVPKFLGGVASASS